MANKNKVFWPSWRYGPEGASGIFQSENDVPAGWVENPNGVVEPDAPKPEDGSDAWGGHTKKELQAALRKSGEKVHAATSARKLFEKAVEFGAIPGYGKPDSD